ncbi:MAG: formylglycine-generating enzyme family protein [Fibrobacteres bacterium]|nr:formylglycine-generating enzyme family protein [Fibrobacterota bacterium]
MGDCRMKGMALIPEGQFIMGSQKDKKRKDLKDESPPHIVMLDAFFMDLHPVTQAEYLAVMGVNPSRNKESPECPVEQVSWLDAVEYCNRVGKRLPTEAEWEYACRAGSDTEFYWGANLADEYAWSANNSGGKTHAVCQKKPNTWGLYDMAGNVWEWCSDWYDPRYYAKSPDKNPQGSVKGECKVQRGGSFLDNTRTLRSANRYGNFKESRISTDGFRCVMTIV